MTCNECLSFLFWE